MAFIGVFYQVRTWAALSVAWQGRALGNIFTGSIDFVYDFYEGYDRIIKGFLCRAAQLKIGEET